MLHEHQKQHCMACRQDCMHKACIHLCLCRRPGFFAARPEAISAWRAPHVRACSMSCCMNIATDMKNEAYMLNMRHGHVHARACRPLCARACGRGSFRSTTASFDAKQKTERRLTFPLERCAGSWPRQTPASASAAARLTVADKFCNGWRGNTPFGHTAA